MKFNQILLFFIEYNSKLTTNHIKELIGIEQL